MLAGVALKRIMCGVEVDSTAQPLKVWRYTPSDGALYDEYHRGAYEVYHRLSRLTQEHSDEYLRGRSDQKALLPKRTGSRSKKAIAWGRYMGGGTWHLGDNW